MDREYSTARQIYNRYVIDDGWSENMPMEIIDVIELHVQMAEREAEKRVLEEHRKHKGDWLTADIAKKYRNNALIYLMLTCGQYVGKVRELGAELQGKYGVTELEAINILNNHNIKEYVNKYYRIKNLIPLRINEDAVWEDTLADLNVAI